MSVDDLQSNLENNKKQLEKQISSIETMQTELYSHILTLTNTIQHLETLARNEKDPSKKVGYYKAITRNMELLVKFYATYKEYCDTRFRYDKQITDMVKDYDRLINIELVKLEKGMSEDSGVLSDLFIKVTKLLNESPKQNVLENLDEKYSL